MAQISYTDPGSMNKLIDFWDNPREPNPDGSSPTPLLFVSGVLAKIATSWSVTQARRLPQQILPESTHQIIIAYRAGLRQRMHIEYNDPDRVEPRRFDIDRIADPDEQKHELQILATERADAD